MTAISAAPGGLAFTLVWCTDAAVVRADDIGQKASPFLIALLRPAFLTDERAFLLRYDSTMNSTATTRAKLNIGADASNTIAIGTLKTFHMLH